MFKLFGTLIRDVLDRRRDLAVRILQERLDDATREIRSLKIVVAEEHNRRVECDQRYTEIHQAYQTLQYARMRDHGVDPFDETAAKAFHESLENHMADSRGANAL